MIPKKPAPDLIRGVQRFSEKIMLNKKLERDDDSRKSHSALGLARQKDADCRRIDLGLFLVRGRQCPGFAGAPDQHGVTDLDTRSAIDSGVDRDVGDL